MEFDRKLKLELKGSSILKPLEVIESDLSKVESTIPTSIARPVLIVNSIKNDNKANMAILKEKTTVLQLHKEE